MLPFADASTLALLVNRTDAHLGFIHSVVFSPNGRQIASGGAQRPSGGDIRLWGKQHWIFSFRTPDVSPHPPSCDCPFSLIRFVDADAARRRHSSSCLFCLVPRLLA
eukprot:5600961-Prymnesium_polylepis.1